MTQRNTDSYSQKDLDTTGIRRFQNQWLLLDPTASKRGETGKKRPFPAHVFLCLFWSSTGEPRAMGCNELKLLTRTELSLIKLSYVQSVSKACPWSGQGAPRTPHKGPSHSPSPCWEPSLGQEPVPVVPHPGRSWKIHRRGAQPSH